MLGQEATTDKEHGALRLKRHTEIGRGLISGLVAQSELTQLLDEIYEGGNDLLDELYNSHGLPSLDKAEADRRSVLYIEVASVFA